MSWFIQQVPALAAAVVAVASAVSARNSAGRIAGLGHKVAGIDRSIETLRDDFRAFIRSLNVEGPPHLAAGGILAASEVLRANPLSTPRADELAAEIVDHFAVPILRGDSSLVADDLGTPIAALRVEVRRILEDVVNDRVLLIESATRPAQLNRLRPPGTDRER